MKAPTTQSIKKSASKKLELSRALLHHLIGKAIAKYRKSVGLSHYKLAENLGLGNEVVRRIGRGIAVPTIQRLKEITEIFGCPLADLVTETSNRPTDETIYLQSLLLAYIFYSRMSYKLWIPASKDTPPM